MEALQKDFLEYLTIQEATFLDSEKQVLKKLSVEDLELANGHKFLQSSLFPVDGQASYFHFKVLDPNTNQIQDQIHPILPIDGPAALPICKLAESHYLASLK